MYAKRLLITIPTLLAFALLGTIATQRTADAALANNGFETGDLTGWTTGTTTAEGITVVGTDTIVPDDAGTPGTDETLAQAPLEGNFMARLGAPSPTSTDHSQPIGQNELIQDFPITGDSLRFAYNIWTYDYTGFDNFEIKVTVSGTFEDIDIYSYRQQAWGATSDTSRKNTGWQVVNLDTTGYEGSNARLTIRSGGSQDQLYPFWTYIDSAENTAPPDIVDFGGIRVNGYVPSSDPVQQTIHILRSPGGAAVFLSVPVRCPDGSTPDSVTAVVGTSPPSVTPLTNVGNSVWEGSIPTPPGVKGNSFPITLIIICNGQTISIFIGTITLIDPSGFITDADTGDPVVGATVVLQRFDNAAWAKLNPFETKLGAATSAPQVNPQLTDDEGHYGWDVIEGKYRVVVSAPGYISQVSVEVTVPPPVLDLNLQLVPIGSSQTPAPTTPHVTGTPVPGGNIWGDGDCSGSVNPVDSLKVLRKDAGIDRAGPQGACPALGFQIVVNSVMRVWGDLDCSGGLNPVDSLKTLRFDAGLSVVKIDPSCPNAGAGVTIGNSTAAPSQTATATPTHTAAPTSAGPTATPVVTATPTGAPGNPSQVLVVTLQCNTNPEYVEILNNGVTPVSLAGFSIFSDPDQQFSLSPLVSTIAGGQTLRFESGSNASTNSGAGIYALTGSFIYRDLDPSDYARLVRPNATQQQLNCASGVTATAPPTATPPPVTSCANLEPPILIPDDYNLGLDLFATNLPGGVITDLDLCLNIEHPWIGDLIITLEHVETATKITLLDIPGCSGQDMYVYFDDEAASSVQTSCGSGQPALDGAYRPAEMLSAFDGDTFDGTWIINIADVEFAFVGQVLGALFQYSTQ